MSDLAIGGGAAGYGSGDGAFRLRTVLIVLAVGIAGFVAMLLFAAHAPADRSGHDGGGHALSLGATGYAAIVDLAGTGGIGSVVRRDTQALGSEDLLVVTPPAEFIENEALAKLLAARGPRPTLVVLPKWSPGPDPLHGGWVALYGTPAAWLVAPESSAGAAKALGAFKVHRYRSGGRPLVATGNEVLPGVAIDAPRPLQTVAGAGLVPLLTDAAGHAVLARSGNGHTYLLADPDLLANWRMRRLDRAAAAVALLTALNSTGARTIGFDVTLNGLGRPPNLLRLAFEPPMLALTLALAAAVLLVGIHAFGRFGPARRRERAVAFGKAALLDNTAGVVRMARREVALAPRYAAALRARAARAQGAPAALGGGALEAWLDRAVEAPRFSDLARRVVEAGDTDELLAAARALRTWGRRR